MKINDLGLGKNDRLLEENDLGLGKNDRLLRENDRLLRENDLGLEEKNHLLGIISSEFDFHPINNTPITTRMVPNICSIKIFSPNI